MPNLRAYCERAADGAAESAAGTPIRFVISREGVKRDGLNLVVGGVRLDNYRRNPVVTWAHDMMGNRLPIGRAEVIADPSGERLDADITFDQGDEFARQVERKYREGFLHAVSVNWTSLDMNGRDVTDWELLEIAAVPVPGDPDALMQRQYQVLREMIEAKDADTSTEDPWRELASEMARLYLPGSDDDEDREKRYRALLPKYRRMGKTAPEFVPNDELAALSAGEIRGLFLEGEEAFYPVEVEQRSGAVLSRRNMDDLRQALTLIDGVIQRAQKEIEADEAEEAPEEEQAKDEEEPEDDDAERGAVLANILNRLQTVGGQND